jgi:hypothetical protein
VSLIHCTSSCIYQEEGYCKLEQAAEISGSARKDQCLHYKATDTKTANADPQKIPEA